MNDREAERIANALERLADFTDRLETIAITALVMIPMHLRFADLTGEKVTQVTEMVRAMRAATRVMAEETKT